MGRLSSFRDEGKQGSREVVVSSVYSLAGCLWSNGLDRWVMGYVQDTMTYELIPFKLLFVYC